MISKLLDRIGAGEGIWFMAMSALVSLVGLVVGHKIAGSEFVSAFTAWATAVFGSAAIAGFRDWKKPQNPPPTP